jgi:hypothetical protein
VILDNNLPNSDWGELRHSVPLFFLLHINDLLKIVNDNTQVVLYTDDTGIVFTSLSPTNFTNIANETLRDINKWFTTNLLSLNAEKTQYMQFVTP